jgi:hypothetical protein
MTSKSAAWSSTVLSVASSQGAGSPEKPDGHSATGTVGTSRPGTIESPEAKVVTSWPRWCSSATRAPTTRSVPPYATGGTATSGGATSAILK